MPPYYDSSKAHASFPPSKQAQTQLLEGAYKRCELKAPLMHRLAKSFECKTQNFATFAEMDLRPTVMFLVVLCLSTTAGMFYLNCLQLRIESVQTIAKMHSIVKSTV